MHSWKLDKLSRYIKKKNYLKKETFQLIDMTGCELTGLLYRSNVKVLNSPIMFPLMRSDDSLS